MMRVTMEFPSATEIRALDRQAQNVVRKALTKAVRETWKAMKRRIEATVRRPGPSAPGEPTAADEGEYGRAFYARVRSRGARRGKPPEIEAMLFNREWQTVGLRQEYGTQHMAPRPHVRPELERTRPIIERALALAQYEALAGLAGDTDEEV
jgi:hypothetical protein